MIIQQISVFLENRAGQLAEITGLLSQKNINLRAINIAETRDYGVLRMIAEDPEETSALLKENGILFSTNPVVAVHVEDKPGALSDVLNRMADANMDVEYMYSIFGEVDGKACMIFKVAEPEELDALMSDR